MSSHFQGRGNPVLSQGEWRIVWGLAARPEQPDVRREQRVGDGIQERKEGRLEKPHCLLSALRHTGSFPSQSADQHSSAPGKVGPTTCSSSCLITPLKVLPCVRPQFPWWQVAAWQGEGQEGHFKQLPPPESGFPMAGRETGRRR